MNNVCLIGNIALDPELKKTQNGKDVCTVRLGVPSRYRDENGERRSEFLNIQCWDQSARFVCNYLKKGDRIAVVGELRTRSYIDKDGAKHNVVEIVARDVESLTAKRDGPEEPKKTESRSAEFMPIDDDDLPF